MQKWTETEIERFVSGARQDYVSALVDGWDDIQRAGINTPLRLCEFLAQCAHETGGFTIIREDTTWTAKRMCKLWPNRFKTTLDPRILACGRDPVKLANLAYGTRKDLGNQGGDDGWTYRGGGFLQMTGRGGFREYGFMSGYNLEANPDLIEEPPVSLRVALAVWMKKDCNRLADRNYTRAIGNAINAGNAYRSADPNGHDERLQWFKRAWAFFGEEKLSPLPGLALGAYGPQVEALQIQLRNLGYGVGRIDKVFGPATARAVAGFKADHKRATGEVLEEDEIVGPLTLEALSHGRPIELSPDRAAATVKQLAADGSSEIAAGQTMQGAGTALTVAGAAAGVSTQTGAVDAIGQQLSWAPALHMTLMPVMEALRWGFQNAFWVLAIVGGVWAWTGGYKVIWARLKAHRLGFNLFR